MGRGGGLKKGLGPRNDVLTTCKATRSPGPLVSASFRGNESSERSGKV